jgi:hypothetical protein
MSEGFGRPGNVELQKAMKHLVRYLAKYGTGVAKQDRARWAIGYGVNRDTSGKYWRQLIDAGVITEADVDGKYKKTPYFNELLEMELAEEQPNSANPSQPKPTIEQAIDKKMKEYAEIKAKMKAGPCKGRECPPGTEYTCRYCGGFLNLKNKDWLEE